MIVLAVVLSAAAVFTAVVPGAAGGHGRLVRILSAASGPRQRLPYPRLSSVARRRTVAVFVGCCCAVVVGGIVGAALGVFVAVGCERGLGVLEPRARRRRRERLVADLPIAADLLAGCLLAGSTREAAAESVALAVGGPLEEVLRGVVASIRLGADPSAAWLSIADDSALEPLARTVARAVSSGAPLAEALARLADDQRGERRRAATAAAQRLGVRAAVPLGVCFLPAFVLLGVVPVIGAIIQRVLSA